MIVNIDRFILEFVEHPNQPVYIRVFEGKFYLGMLVDWMGYFTIPSIPSNLNEYLRIYLTTKLYKSINFENYMSVYELSC